MQPVIYFFLLRLKTSSAIHKYKKIIHIKKTKFKRITFTQAKNSFPPVMKLTKNFHLNNLLLCIVLISSLTVICVAKDKSKEVTIFEWTECRDKALEKIY